MYWTLLRFDSTNLNSWSSIVKLLNKPCDPSLLGYLRIAFGFLMMIDIPQERGMSHVDRRFGNGDQYCSFPYIHHLRALSLDNMVLVYFVMLLGAMGIFLGLFYRLSCLCFASCYWYIFLLDKTAWNNHSYLYGVISIFFLCVDAHRYASLDGLLNKKIRNSSVPQYMYTLIRFQIFIVYFLAGIKKTDLDWLQGYSMNNLSRHWVFDPFKMFFDEEFLNLFMVHKFGFLLDLTIGFFMFWDLTRPFAFIFCASFNLMNSQMFSIGMFSYTMVASMFCFCKSDSFKKLITKLPRSLRFFDTHPPQHNPNCACETEKKNDDKEKPFSPSCKQVVVTCLVFWWMAVQLFLPFSHFITKGYNNWTEGPYGYSWDMMVQNTATQHSKITYVDRDGNVGYLQPNAFLVSKRDRWSLHPDHAVQYARCLKEKLAERGVPDAKIYFDVWKSLNKRFVQRIFDPSVDIAAYDWSPFRHVTFAKPLMSELSGWREKLKVIRRDLKTDHRRTVFIADFPGLTLENFVEGNRSSVTIELLRGKVTVDHVTPDEGESGEGEEEQQQRVNITLVNPGDKVEVATDHFHYVHTISSEPSCYFYSYKLAISENNSEEAEDDGDTKDTRKSTSRKSKPQKDPLDKFIEFAATKAMVFRRGLVLVKYAVKHKVFGPPASLEEFLNEKRDIDFWRRDAKKEQLWIDEYDEKHHNVNNDDKGSEERFTGATQNHNEL